MEIKELNQLFSEMSNIHKVNYELYDNFSNKSKSEKITFKDEFGYMYYVSYHNIKNNYIVNNKKPNILNNTYAIKNIILWLKLNKPQYELISTEYKGIRSKLKFKCNIHNRDFYCTFYNMKERTGCPECSERNREEITLSDLKKFANDNIEIIASEDEKINKRTNIICRCKIHNCEWKVSTYSIQNTGGYCPECITKSKSGENASNWKGGITPLHLYLRESLTQWKKDSMKACDYKCIITGNNFDIVHHLYGFDNILQEVVISLNIPILEQVNQYTDLELEKIRNKCLELHYKYGLGVCLSGEVHKLFHSIYGYGNNTPNQFEEFKININTQNIGFLNSNKKEKFKNKIKSKDNNRIRKAIAIFDKNNNLVGKFDSLYYIVKNSMNILGIELNKSAVSLVANGKKPQYKGYTFKYI